MGGGYPWPMSRELGTYVSSDDHQMSLAGGKYLCLQWWPPDVTSKGVGTCISSDDHQMSLSGGLYSEVQCIMGNGHMGTPPSCEQTYACENITFPQLR